MSGVYTLDKSIGIMFRISNPCFDDLVMLNKRQIHCLLPLLVPLTCSPCLNMAEGLGNSKRGMCIN